MGRTWSVALAIGFATLAGCSDTAGPSGATRAAAGIYILQSADGSYAPESGRLSLLPTGKAERRVSYARDGQPPLELVSQGSFRVDGSNLSLELVQQGTDFPYTWRPLAKIDGPTVTLSYPGPADGTITEIYRR